MVAFGLRQERLEFDGTPVSVRELTAKETNDIWGALTSAESSGNVLQAYYQVVQLGTLNGGGNPMFPTAESVEQAPVRIIMALAEKIMALSDIHLDAGKDSGALSESSPIA